MKYNILIVEDEKNQAELIAKILAKKGFNSIIANTLGDALSAVTQNRIDLVLTDYKLPDGDGFGVITRIKNLNPEVLFVVMTAFGDVEIAVKCLKAGASDFLAKPINLNELEKIIFRLLQNKILIEEVNQLRRDVEILYTPQSICGTSERLTAQISKALKVANSDSNVLICGESGTGKELFTNLIHYNSDRKNKSFIKVNCSAIPVELMESELFGHLKGAYTGAYADKIGKFEAADGGTLFLDEIGELPVNLQAKLLRVLQEKEIEPIGANHSKKINVRMIFATNKDLEKAILNNEFREDLYYRISTITLNLPPLRDRKEDIPLLLKYFINKYNEKLKRNIKEFSSDAVDALIKYSWPGNIRELQNIIENTMVLMNEHDETIYTRNLPEKIYNTLNNLVEREKELSGFEKIINEYLEKSHSENRNVNIGDFLDNIEKIALIWAANKTGGIKTEMARFFEIDEKSIRNKLKKYNL
ncbi:MAG: sigma-54 dependent transcriptional regulator [Candidatus Wallbacteria bacterium]